MCIVYHTTDEREFSD